MKLFGPGKPLKYSSAATRSSSLHDFMGGADFNETYQMPGMCPGEVTDNYEAMNIKSGCNQTDIPSKYGFGQKGIQKLGGQVFTQGNILSGWWRVNGEPVDTGD